MIKDLLNLALWLAGVGHFVVLIASVQVPSYFNWKEDFAKLTPFNRKLVWTYATYVFLMIFSFGVLTLVLHDELLRGERSALALSLLIGLFWLGRIALDAFSFSHKTNWPAGTKFVVGHILLTSLFVCLTGTYLGLVIWHISS